MHKKLLISAVVFAFAVSCSKQVKVEEKPVAPLSASDREFIRRFRALERPAVSAGFNIYWLMGSFKGELYLEPGDKTLSLVYGYMPLGKSLFEFKLSGRDFLYLDLANSYAYSNRKDWLHDYTADAVLADQDQMALMLISALQALAGDIPEPLSVSVSGKNSAVLVASPAEDYSVKYYFDSDSLRLMKMEIKKQQSAMSLEFEYSDFVETTSDRSGFVETSASVPSNIDGTTADKSVDKLSDKSSGHWFPESIKLNSDRVSALMKMEKIACPESSRPKINFEIPPGFVNILLTDH